MTPPEPGVGAVWFRLLLDALAGVGVDARTQCRRRGWDPDIPGDSPTRVPWSRIVAIWEAAARSSGDPLLGLHAAESLPYRTESPFGYLLMTSPTLLRGLGLMVRYQDLLFDGNALSLDDRGEHFAIKVCLPEQPPSLFHQVEYVCALLRRRCAHTAGPAFRLLGARFRHAGPAGAGEHERVFGCRVEFRQPENTLLVARETMALPSLFANPDLHEAVQAIAERRLDEVRSPVWALKVKAAVRPQLGACRVGDVARLLGVSRRDLQRKLAGERTSYAKVLDQTRQDRSLELIRRPATTVAAIAAQVGFADSRAFVRAFQRWTGQSPSAYRAWPAASSESRETEPTAQNP